MLKIDYQPTQGVVWSVRHAYERAGAVVAQDNSMLGKFQLEGIPPAPRGVPQVTLESGPH
jgi:molecular chaperone DnaK (HSP70)